MAAADTQRGARVLAFAWLFALAALCLQWFVAHAFSAFAASASYELGAFACVGAQLCAGLLFALPLLLRSRRAGRVLSTLLAALAFALLAAAYHYHALFARLPTLVSFGALRDPGKLVASLEDALPPWVWALEVAVPSAMLLALLEPLARVLAGVRARRAACGSTRRRT